MQLLKYHQAKVATVDRTAPRMLTVARLIGHFLEGLHEVWKVVHCVEQPGDVCAVLKLHKVVLESLNLTTQSRSHIKQIQTTR